MRGDEEATPGAGGGRREFGLHGEGREGQEGDVDLCGGDGEGRVGEGDQVGGFLDGLDAGDARDG